MNHCEQLIRTYVHLPGGQSGTGWYPILCKVCNDHGRKGPRAGFRFEEDGVGYHCFNCGIKGSYYPHFKSVPRDMEQVFTAFGIPEDEINKLRLAALQERDESGQYTPENKQEGLIINPKELPLPEHFYLLSEASEDDTWAEIARYYLEDRKIDPSDYPFYMSTGIPTNYPESQKAIFVKAAQKWRKRVIIPIYKDHKLIYYQGRDLSGKALKKYESPSAPKERVIFGFDRLFTDEDRPLYVCEGFFDAFHIEGVALLGNELTDAQISWLNKSRREKVYVPDKGKAGKNNALRALEQGWKVTTPDIGNCTDVNAAIVKYGELYVHQTLKDETKSGFSAETAINLYCMN